MAALWTTPLALLFIDGGHGAGGGLGGLPRPGPRRSPPGGYLAIHDVFPDPADGGRPPYELYCAARASGWIEQEPLDCGSLRVLRRPG